MIKAHERSPVQAFVRESEGEIGCSLFEAGNGIEWTGVQTSEGGNDQERSGLECCANSVVPSERIHPESCWCGALRWAWRRLGFKVWLTSSESSRRKAMNGMEDSLFREGQAAVGGEKPLKGGTHERFGLKQGREVGETVCLLAGRPRLEIG